jgi:hypothetical protein
MALKMQLDKAAHDALDDAGKAHYKQVGETDVYKLDVEGLDDPAELRRARDREKARADESADALRKANEKLAETTNADARKAGDIATLEKSWKDKLDTTEAGYKNKLSASEKRLEKILIHDKASEIATEISTVPVAMARMLSDRLRVEFDGDEPIVRVLTEDGKPSALSLSELKAEMVANPKFAGMIVGSKATGSGAGGQSGGGASKKLSEMNDADRTEMYRRDPAGFQRMVDADKAARSQS